MSGLNDYEIWYRNMQNPGAVAIPEGPHITSQPGIPSGTMMPQQGKPNALRALNLSNPLAFDMPNVDTPNLTSQYRVFGKPSVPVPDIKIPGQPQSVAFNPASANPAMPPAVKTPIPPVPAYGPPPVTTPMPPAPVSALPPAAPPAQPTINVWTPEEVNRIASMNRSASELPFNRGSGPVPIPQPAAPPAQPAPVAVQSALPSPVAQGPVDPLTNQPKPAPAPPAVDPLTNQPKASTTPTTSGRDPLTNQTPAQKGQSARGSSLTNSADLNQAAHLEPVEKVVNGRSNRLGSVVDKITKNPILRGLAGMLPAATAAYDIATMSPDRRSETGLKTGNKVVNDASESFNTTLSHLMGGALTPEELANLHRQSSSLQGIADIGRSLYGDYVEPGFAEGATNLAKNFLTPVGRIIEGAADGMDWISRGSLGNLGSSIGTALVDARDSKYDPAENNRLQKEHPILGPIMGPAVKGLGEWLYQPGGVLAEPEGARRNREAEQQAESEYERKRIDKQIPVQDGPAAYGLEQGAAPVVVDPPTASAAETGGSLSPRARFDAQKRFNAEDQLASTRAVMGARGFAPSNLDFIAADGTKPADLYINEADGKTRYEIPGLNAIGGGAGYAEFQGKRFVPEAGQMGGSFSVLSGRTPEEQAAIDYRVAQINRQTDAMRRLNGKPTMAEEEANNKMARYANQFLTPPDGMNPMQTQLWLARADHLKGLMEMQAEQAKVQRMMEQKNQEAELANSQRQEELEARGAVDAARLGLDKERNRLTAQGQQQTAANQAATTQAQRMKVVEQAIKNRFMEVDPKTMKEFVSLDRIADQYQIPDLPPVNEPVAKGIYKTPNGFIGIDDNGDYQPIPHERLIEYFMFDDQIK